MRYKRITRLDGLREGDKVYIGRLRRKATIRERLSFRSMTVSEDDGTLRTYRVDLARIYVSVVDES